MQKIAKILSFFLLVFSSQLQSSFEIDTIKSVLNYIDPKKATLLLLDIDNTLLQTSFDQDFGSDQWIENEIQKNITKGMNRDQAFQEVWPLYLHINLAINLIPTEQNLIKDLAEIKKRCNYVICLTARSFHLAERTLEQLMRNNLFFTIQGLDNISINLSHPLLYKDGVLFCGYNNKGEAIEYFLTYSDYKPEVIIFVDDKERNLHSLEATCKKLNIEFIGLRYTGCDNRVQVYDATKTQQDLAKFLEQCPFETSLRTKEQPASCYRKFLNNKLVRNNTIDHLIKHGSIIHWYQLDDESFAYQLKKKLLEEADEVFHAKNRESLREELADVLEVIDAICQANNLNLDDIKITQEEKRKERGGFSERKFVTFVEHPVGSFMEQYCLNDPEKYPEVME